MKRLQPRQSASFYPDVHWPRGRGAERGCSRMKESHAKPRYREFPKILLSTRSADDRRGVTCLCRTNRVDALYTFVKERNIARKELERVEAKQRQQSSLSGVWLISHPQRTRRKPWRRSASGVRGRGRRLRVGAMTEQPSDEQVPRDPQKYMQLSICTTIVNPVNL